MTNNDYWDEYYGFWDKFVEDWFNQRPNDPTDVVSREYKRCVKDLNFDELPVPYLGDHNKAKAVIINLNPGMSEPIPYGRHKGESAEATQCYANIDDPIGWLIKKFRDNFGKKYSDFIREYSCLNPKHRGREPYVCGVKWWQGIQRSTVGGRMDWIARVYEKALDASESIQGEKDKINPLEVFALELCPYHSLAFRFDDAGIDRLQHVKEFVVENVMRPALNVVVEKGLSFATAIGKTFAILLEKIGSDGKFGIAAKLEKEWWDESDDVVEDWPEARDNKTGEMRRVHRKYCLFALKDKNERLARFLVCAAPGSNGTPGEEFENVEKEQIIPYIKCHLLTNEWYEQLKPVKLRWWNYTGKKGVSLEKPKVRRPQAQQDMARGDVTLRGGSMTPEQRDDVLQMLRNKGIAGCRYQAGSKDFILFSKGTVGNFFIKENTRSIGFYGVETAIMREWADKRLRSFIGQNAIFNGWRLDVKKSSKSSPKGMWFRLRVDTHGWYDHREEVVAVAVTLYNELQRQGILADDFTASKFK